MNSIHAFQHACPHCTDTLSFPLPVTGESAKLFEFVPENASWRERGQGEIKVLVDREGSGRMVMRSAGATVQVLGFHGVSKMQESYVRLYRGL